MAKINEITMYRYDINVWFDDTDTMTDYFHHYSLPVRQAIEWIKEKGADEISVTVVNNDESIPTMRRLKQIAKTCGYKIEDRSEMRVYKATGEEYKYLEYLLRR
ncbi:hypothetical protein B6U67_00800 [Methanosarcinales archaeon ex4484_138]|nr:MAG: hypothetical protein B6U67_00800 [Methanosarcinales archaeon ex4484_138]